MLFVKWDKNKTESKIDILTHVFTEMKLVLEPWWVGARERKKSSFFVRLFGPNIIFLTFVFYLNM